MGVEEHPAVAELREKMRLHDDWPTKETGYVVIEAARRLIRAIDQRGALIEHMRAHMTPTAQAIGEILSHSGGGG